MNFTVDWNSAPPTFEEIEACRRGLARLVRYERIARVLLSLFIAISIMCLVFFVGCPTLWTATASIVTLSACARTAHWLVLLQEVEMPKRLPGAFVPPPPQRWYAWLFDVLDSDQHGLISTAQRCMAQSGLERMLFLKEKLGQLSPSSLPLVRRYVLQVVEGESRPLVELETSTIISAVCDQIDAENLGRVIGDVVTLARWE